MEKTSANKATNKGDLQNTQTAHAVQYQMNPIKQVKSQIFSCKKTYEMANT